jgi:3-deoxy-7-phosphoheptulonate synthase
VDGATSAVRTRGNPDRHLVLRGGSDGPNHGPERVAEAAARLAPEGLARPVMVDVSHGNSGKDHTRQPAVCRSVLEQLRAGQGSLLGVLVESHLVAGRQDWMPGKRLVHGQSITDACIGWDETEALLEEIAEAARARAARGAPQ